MPRILLVAVLFCLAAIPPARADVAGKPDVVDGATLRIAGQTVHLFAIKAPAPGRRCRVAGEVVDCAFQATNALSFLTAFHWVRCRPVGRVADGIVARCTMADRYDIAEKMVRAGWALADRKLAPQYGAAEDAARAEHAGLWAGEK